MKAVRTMWMVGAAGAVISITIVAMTAPIILGAVTAIAASILILWKLGWWRGCVAFYFIISVLRGVSAIPDSITYVAQFGPIALSIISLISGGGRVLPRSDRNILFALGSMIVAALVSIFTSVSPTTSASQAGLLAIMFLFLGLTYWKRWDQAKVVKGDLTFLFVLVSITQIIGLLAWFLNVPFALADYGRFQGLLGNANYAGYLSAILLPFGVFIFGQTKHRLIAVGGSSVGLVTLILSGSRGGILAACVGLLALFCLHSGRKALVPLAIVVGLALTVTLFANPFLFSDFASFFSRTQQASDFSSGRTGIYATLMHRWLTAPVFGTGFRTTETVDNGTAGHNSYLSILTETGIVGAIALVAIIVTVARVSRSGGTMSALFGSVVAIATMELTESSLLGWGATPALMDWLLILGLAALGRMAAEHDSEPAVHDYSTHPLLGSRSL